MFEQHFMNGGHSKDVPPAAKDLGSQTVWAQCDAPLRLVEGDFISFAKEHGLVLRNGSIGWPSRTLEWSSDIDRVIQLYLDDKSKLTYTLVVGAKSDRGDKRFLRALPLREAVEIEEIAGELPGLLETAFDKVNGWCEDDLDFSVERPSG